MSIKEVEVNVKMYLFYTGSYMFTLLINPNMTLFIDSTLHSYINEVSLLLLLFYCNYSLMHTQILSCLRLKIS